MAGSPRKSLTRLGRRSASRDHRGRADLDPAGSLTATVAGASFGYSLGWVVVLCVPVLFSVFCRPPRGSGTETRRGWWS